MPNTIKVRFILVSLTHREANKTENDLRHFSDQERQTEKRQSGETTTKKKKKKRRKKSRAFGKIK